VSPERQIQINRQRNQVPEYREVKIRILKKSKSLVRNLTAQEKVKLRQAGLQGRFLCNDAGVTPEIPDQSVQLTVTSPPFLNVVQYAKDNWLRCWFNGLDARRVEEGITSTSSLAIWNQVMQAVFAEIYRITAPEGWVAFEVGEVNKGTVNLDEQVVPLGLKAGFNCVGILLNVQEFTKTANIWGISNNASGTNTNRIVLFYKG